MNSKKLKLWMGFFLLSLCISGCSLLAVFGDLFSGSDKIEPKILLEDKVVAIIPFKDDVYTYCESEEGLKISRAIMEDIVANQDSSNMKSVGEGKTNDLKRYFQYFQDISWKKVAEMAHADLLLVGEIEEFTTKLSTNVGLYRGKIKVNFQVYDGKKEKVLLKKSLELYYPKNIEGSYFPPGTSPEEIQQLIENGLFKRVGAHIGREFYTYKKEDDLSVD